MEERNCPCCGRHCSLDEPNCEKGIAYAKVESVLPDRHDGDRDEWLKARKERYRTLDTNNKLICNIRDMGHTVRALSDGKASQSRILIVLNEDGMITQSALTERLGVQPGTASEVIAKLERSGLIVRAANEQDRRTSELRLTEEGVRKAIQSSTERKNRYEDMFACLTENEKTELLGLLEKVNEDWQQRYGDKRARGHGENCHGEYPHGKHDRGEYRHGGGHRGHGRHDERH